MEWSSFWPDLAEKMLDEWRQVAATKPNERVPQERQSQALVYAELRTRMKAVCLERGYGPIGEGDRRPCDLWAQPQDGPPLFMEIKHSATAVNLQCHPPEEFRRWAYDWGRLASAGEQSHRCFVLVAFFSILDLEKPAPTRGLREAIEQLPREGLAVGPVVKDFTWRDEGIKHMGIWIWHWPVGTGITLPPATFRSPQPLPETGS